MWSYCGVLVLSLFSMLHLLISPFLSVFRGSNQVENRINLESYHWLKPLVEVLSLNFCLLDLPKLLRSYFASRIYIPLLLFNKLLDIAGELFLFLTIRYDRIRYDLFRHTLLDHIVQVNLMRQYFKSPFFFSKFFQL